MNRLLSSLLFLTGSLLGNSFYATAQVPTKQWDTTLGGTLYDTFQTIQQTSDGGYIGGGYSPSPLSSDKTQPSQGSNDYWVVRLDATGTKRWDRTLGSSREDLLRWVQPTSDGGYLLGGFSDSPIGGDKTQASRGFDDFWVVKLDASGTKLWDRTLGGSGVDRLTMLQQTSDGGYILAGTSASPSSGEKTQGALGREDYWVLKLDATGTKQWDRTFGGSGVDYLAAVRQTNDGGFVLGGYSDSPAGGDKTQASRGGDDYWVVRLDATGTKLWDRTVGGSAADQLTMLQQTSDGGYVLGGASFSGLTGDKTQASRGNWDYWVVKLDGTGLPIWDRAFGGASEDRLSDLQQTRDGGYVLVGSSSSPVGGDKTQPLQGIGDYWLLQLDANGTRRWDVSLGGDSRNLAKSVRQTMDGGYIVGGNSDSGVSGDKSQASQTMDYWLIKLGPLPLATTIDVAATGLVSPGPTQGCYGATENITVSIQNNGSAPLDFAVTPATVTVNVTGAATQTLTATLSTGTLAPGASQNVSVAPSLNMSTPGTYTFAITATVPGDQNPANDALTPAPTRMATAPVAGTATTPVSSLCQSGTATLSLTGSANGTIQWQQSADNVTFTDLSGANAATYATGTLTTTTYFRARTSCTTTVATSNVLMVTVTAAPTATLPARAASCGTAAYALTGTLGGSATTGTYTSTGTGSFSPNATMLNATYTPSAVDVMTGSVTITLTAAGPTGTACAASTASLVLTLTPATTATFSYASSTLCVSGTAATPTVTGTTGGMFSSTTGLTLNASTGAITPSTSTPGTYTVTYSVGGSCPTSDTATVTITTAPVATFSYGSASYCVSGPTPATPVFASGASAGTFSSTTGLILSTSTGIITPATSTPGTYTVTNTLAAANGCAAATATFTVTIIAAPVATFTYANAAYCVGATDMATPVLSTGATAGTFTASGTGLVISSAGVINLSTSTAGTYTVTNTIAAASGCAIITATFTVTINARPVQATFTPTYNGATTTLTSTSATGNQWHLGGGAIVGATSSTYVVNSAAQFGAYTVVVTDPATGCSSLPSLPLIVNSSVKPLAGSTLSVYPNPTTDGNVTVELNGYPKATELSVYNAVGQLVRSTSVAGKSGVQIAPIALHQLPAGMYLLRVRTEGGLDVRRITKE